MKKSNLLQKGDGDKSYKMHCPVTLFLSVKNSTNVFRKYFLKANVQLFSNAPFNSNKYILQIQQIQFKLKGCLVPA